MALKEKVESDVKQAMREGNVLARDTLRMVLSAFKNRRIELGQELDIDQETAVLRSAVKSRMDSAEQFDKGGRPELAEKERAEISVLRGYLPEELGEDETREIVTRIAGELGLTSKKEMGQLMKGVMAEYKGRVDGKVVQRIAADLLA